MSGMFRNGALGGLAFIVSSMGAWAQSPAADPAEPPARTQVIPAQAEPQAFASPEAGFAALAAALARHDDRRLLQILGEAGRRLIRSGDPVADRAAQARFTAAYAARHAIERPTPQRAVLVVGEDDWPLPIPMIQRGRGWRFDARQGGQEILDRRIGRNELDTIEALRALVDAQADYARTAGRQGAFRTYARRLFSTPGQCDGLYWATAEGEPPSPLGPLAAAASAGGYGAPQAGDRPRPFHGYLFRLLEAQGPAAPGGELEYVVGDRMIGGFAALAIPAQYGVSGIQSFLVSHHGTVYQRDLGPQTARLAREIQRFDPGPGWTPVPE